MSASDKKKLRKEQSAAILSEKQRQEQAEAKKLKIYTIAFVSVMIAVVVIALSVLGSRILKNSGIVQKATVAAVIGDHKLNTVELSYYYNDAIQEYYNKISEQYQTYTDSYLQAIGLDTTKPLDTQVYNQESGQTWSEFFLETALEKAKSDFALYDEAQKHNFQLPSDEQTTLDNMLNNLETFASISGYSSANHYLRDAYGYGYGADVRSFRAYTERSAIAKAYKQAHEDGLEFEAEKISEYAKDKGNQYNSYTYSSAILSYTDFLEGGTEGEDGKKTYSDAEKDAAREAMKAAAESLATSTSLEALKEAIKAVKVNDQSQLALNDSERVLYSNVLNTHLADWLADEARTEGDIDAIPIPTSEENEETVVNTYYVVYFSSKTDNSQPTASVRHLLVKFPGGTTDELSNETTYTDEEKATAKTKADGYLKTWQEGDATEESFIELVKEHSDDTSAEDGGLFENIHPDSQYVANFRNWAIDPARKAGDAEVIESEYGYHVMYYVGADDMTYRDYMITSDMRTATQEEWYQNLLKPITVTVKNTSKMNLGVILNPNGQY